MRVCCIFLIVMAVTHFWMIALLHCKLVETMMQFMKRLIVLRSFAVKTLYGMTCKIAVMEMVIVSMMLIDKM